MATYSRIKKIKIGDNVFQFFMPSIKVDNVNIASYDYFNLNFNNNFTLSSTAGLTGDNDEYSTATTTISLKLGYTTSGNNRAVQADSNGNLYVTQKDDNSNTFKSFYGTCSTAAANKEKVVTLSTTTGWQLAAGTIVGVKFTYNNTFSATADSHVTLNVNSTGAKNIYYGGGLPTGTNTTAFGIANYINYYMYDGSQWVWLSSSADNNTTYSSKTAASGGTEVSLVTTGEKYTWNSKTSNTGTVTSITLTQGTGISIGSSGTAITTSGSRTISLATITKSNTTSTASPAHGGTFTAIDSITYDDYGRVTAVNTKTITLPASGNTDTKVTVAALTSGTTYYPILATGTGTATRQIDSTLGGIKYISTAGTTSAVGSALLQLGNATASGTANNERGIIRLYGTGANYTVIQSNVASANKTITLPNNTGTVALTTDIPTGNATPTASTFSKFDSSAKMNSTDMTSSQVSNFVNSLDVSGVSPVDFVVEQGISGIWTYRKWNNGIAECWGRYSGTLTHYTTLGSYYGYNAGVPFPTGLFMSNSIPTHTYTASVGQGFAWTGSGISTGNSSITCYALAQLSGSQECVFDIVAKGRWK